MKSIFSLVAGAMLLLATTGAWAQTAPQLPYGIGDAVREGEQTRRQSLPTGGGVPVLPKLVEPQFTLKDRETLLVRHFKVEGPAVVPEADVQAVLAPYEGRKLTVAQIYEAADALTTVYRNRGYLIAKVYVPAQNAQRGVLRLKLVLGNYGAIDVKNQSLANTPLVRGVIDHALAGSLYVERSGIERAMLLLSDLPGAGMPRVVIGAGQQPETTDFVFDVPVAKRVEGYILGDNFGSPYTGRNRVSGNVDVNSLFGFGDKLSVFGIISENEDLKNGRVAYTVPIGVDGLRAEFAAFRTTYVLGGSFTGLGATGTANGVSATMTDAVIRQRDQTLLVWGNFTHKVLNDELLGGSFADRTINLGTAGLTYDRLMSAGTLPWSTSTSVSLTYGHVNFPDILQAAANAAGADTLGDYTKLNFTHTSTVALSDRWSLNANVRAQKSFGKNLDSSEQLGLTGFFGIRSFDEGLAGDSGYIVTPELKYALPDLERYKHSLGLFTDVGGVWLENSEFTTTQRPYTQLNDVGIGYYATYEYQPTRFLLLKAMVARSYGQDSGAELYNRGTKGLIQIGTSF